MSRLVLSRRVGETVIIGDDIRITVSEIDGRTVRILFDCPEDINIVREEIKNGKS